MDTWYIVLSTFSFLMFCWQTSFFGAFFVGKENRPGRHVITCLSPGEIFAAVWTTPICHWKQVHVEMRYAWSLSMEDVSWRSEFGVRKKNQWSISRIAVTRSCTYIGSIYPHPMVTVEFFKGIPVVISLTKLRMLMWRLIGIWYWPSTNPGDCYPGCKLNWTHHIYMKVEH